MKTAVCSPPYWLPEKGQIFKSMGELEDKLVEAGWKLEGHSTGCSRGRVRDCEVGVKNDSKWLIIWMKPCRGGVQITKIDEKPLKSG